MKKNKLKIYYKKHSFKSPLLMFIHGAACDHTIWVFQNRYFYNRNFSTLSIDLPGHGENNNTISNSIKTMSNLVLDLVKQLPHKEVYLIGHSMGSLICLDTLLANMSIIKKAFLIGIAYPMKVNDLLLKKSKVDQNAAIKDMINWSLTDNTKLHGADLIGINLPNLINIVMSNSKNGVLYKDLLACNNFILDEKEIKKIKTPTEIIVGENDIMTPYNNALNLSNILKYSNLTIIKKSGHFHTFEQPSELNNIIEKSLHK